MLLYHGSMVAKIVSTAICIFLLALALPIWANEQNEEIVSPLQESAQFLGIISPLPNISISFQQKQGESSQSSVLGEIITLEENVEDFTITPTPTTSNIQHVTDTFQLPTSSFQRKSGHYTIAVVGDSMVDVMQQGLPQLQSALKNVYPNVTFTLYNFGVGASNLEYAITRLINSYTYLGEGKPSVLSTMPDIVIIESFAYNNFGPGQAGLDHQWLLLAKAVDTIRSNAPGAKIIIASTIAPNGHIFGDSAGLNFQPNDKWQRAETIKTYLENALRFAQSEHIPYADAFHTTLGSDGQGITKYIQDGIHPSGPGGELFAQKVVEAIRKYNLL